MAPGQLGHQGAGAGVRGVNSWGALPRRGTSGRRQRQQQGLGQARAPEPKGGGAAGTPREGQGCWQPTRPWAVREEGLGAAHGGRLGFLVYSDFGAEALRYRLFS